MDKITYLAELAEGLARWVPERERQDILYYYAEYFEEAGQDREAEVVAELGDPWALSSRLAVEGGYVTQEQAASWRPGKKRTRFLVGTAVGLSALVLVSAVGILGVFFMRQVVAPGQAQVEYIGQAVTEAPPIDHAFGDVTIVEGTEYSVGFSPTEGGSLEAFDSIDADIDLGNIEVVAGDDYTLFIKRSEALRDCELTWEVKDGTLRLKDSGQPWQASSWEDFKNMFGMGQWAVDVTITVPEGAFLEKVSVKTGLGNVMLWGMDAEKVTAKTGMGNVECYNARNIRKLDLNTGMGDVNLGVEEVWSGMDIDLESGMGNVEASLGCSESDCAYELESGMGAVTVNGIVQVQSGKSEHKGNAKSCKLEAASGMGDVNVYFTLG